MESGSVRSVTMPNWHGRSSTSTCSLRSWRDDCSAGRSGLGYTLGVKATERGPVADFGVPEMSDELTRTLSDAGGAITGHVPP